MKKLLIGLLALGSISSFAETNFVCDLYKGRDSFASKIGTLRMQKGDIGKGIAIALDRDGTQMYRLENLRFISSSGGYDYETYSLYDLDSQVKDGKLVEFVLASEDNKNGFFIPGASPSHRGNVTTYNLKNCEKVSIL